jgi:hypothetical protein|tara:strand:- start:118 stop:708 length:591 start_codon:yes stop_codon:yes gene_type:complete
VSVVKFWSFLVLLLVAQSSPGKSATQSPNGKYSAVQKKGELEYRWLEIKRDGKSLFQAQSGYGGYTVMSWAPDSRYLAVVEHGTKTTMSLSVYFIDGDEVTAVGLPDFRLNILGRHRLIKGGRYQFDNSLCWKEGGGLHFMTSGSLREGVSNPTDEPENWYHYEVGIKFTRDRGTLAIVQPSVANEKPWEKVSDPK